MFDRFSDRARKVMGLAHKQANRFNHDYIGPEHILLALIEGDSGVAADVLKSRDVDLKRIRHEVEKLVSHGKASVTKQFPFRPGAKKVLELALEEASSLGHDYIGTGHLLLGLIREQKGIVAEVLDVVGVDIEAARVEVLGLMGEHKLTERLSSADAVALFDSEASDDVRLDAQEPVLREMMQSLRELEERVRKLETETASRW